MSAREYFSQRNKPPDGHGIDLGLMRELLFQLYTLLWDKMYFQEWIGGTIVASGITFPITGKLGDGIPRMLFLKLHKHDLWPISKFFGTYTTDDLFDLIEFLHDYVSEPKYAKSDDMNPSSYDKTSGQAAFRSLFNEKLALFEDGYILSEDGEITNRPEEGLDKILSSEIPTNDEPNIRSKVAGAVRKYLSRHSVDADRKDAVRDLVDVLEFLKPRLQEALSERDESDLFNIANNFAIRHHNEKQKSNYDAKLWTSWLFYFYLSTVHLVLRKIRTQQNGETA